MDKQLSNQEIRRYKKHISIPQVGIDGQTKLKKAKVLVIGAGSLGSIVLQQLTSAGIGFIGIVDADLIEESSLLCQVLYDTNDLGKHKAIVAKEKLAHQNPHVEIKIYNIKLRDDYAPEVLKNFDIVVDTTTDESTRYFLSQCCYELNKPLICGKIAGLKGSYIALDNRIERNEGLFYSDESETDKRRKIKAAIGPLPGVIGSFMAAEIIKIITGTGNIIYGRTITFDLGHLELFIE